MFPPSLALQACWQEPRFVVVRMMLVVVGFVILVVVDPVVLVVLVVFIVLVVLVSLRNFKLFKSRAGSENQLTDEIMAWCRINFNKDDIDSKIELNGLSAEEQYFPRISYMKKEIKDHFVDLNEAYLNRLIEDVYSEVYEEE